MGQQHGARRSQPTTAVGDRVLGPLAILSFGLALRLWQIDLGHFDYEQSVLLEKAAALVRDGQIPLETGLDFTIGIREPPLTTFLLAIPMVVSDSPVWIAAFQAMLDAFGAVFVYFVGRSLGGRWAGFAAGLLYAASPAAIFYSRMIWNPQLVPLFSAVGLWGAVGFARYGDGRRLAAALFAVCCAAQLHPSAATELIPVLGVAFLRRRDIEARPLLIVAVVLGAMLAPYVALQVQTDWSDVRTAVAYGFAPRQFRPDTLFVGLSVLSGDFHRQPKTWWPDVDWTLASEPVFWVMLGLIGHGTWGVARQRAGWVMAVWLVLPVVAGLRHSAGVYPHYLLALVPAAAALAGLGLARLRPPRLAALLLVGAVGWRLSDYWSFQQDAAAVRLDWLYGTPLRYTQQAVEQAVQFGDTDRLFVGFAGKSSLTIPALVARRAPLSPFDGSNTLVLGPRGGTYITGTRGLAFDALREHFGPPVSVVPATDGTSLYAVFKVSPDAVRRYLDRPTATRINAGFANVATVRGYEHTPLQAGVAGSVTLDVLVRDAAFPGWSDMRVFAHVIDESGKNWSTSPDAYVNLVGDFEDGDVLVLRQPVDLPADAVPGGYWIETGFYQFSDSGLTYLSREEGGQHSANSLRVGPVRVGGVGAPIAATGVLAVFGANDI